MKRACVIGWPIEHSRSPIIHGAWIKAYGIDGSYTKIAVEPQRAETFLLGLAAEGYAGCNVTIPHKELAFAVAHEKDASAVAVGAANTVWCDDGRLCCANTDTYGFMTHLTVSAPQWQKHDAPVLILGAGGAARAIVYGFLRAGVRRIFVANRSHQRAQELAVHFGQGVLALPWSERDARAAEAGVIVNTTSLGMKGAGDPGIDFSRVRPEAVAADIVYVPLETSFLAAARAHGIAGVDGLGMLLHQAVPGFEKWFGVRPQVTEELRQLVVADIAGHR